MYIESILYYLTWPLLIVVAYYVVRWALRRQDKKLNAGGE